MAKEVAKPFQRVAGHLVLDLVNTLDYRFRVPTAENPALAPIELLATYADLLRFLHEAEVLGEGRVRKLRQTPASAQTLALHEVQQFREALAGVVYAWLEQKEPSRPDLAILEVSFRAAAAHRRLIPGELHLEWEWKGIKSDAAAPLWLLAAAAEELLLSEHFIHLRSCASEDCHWLFLDTSKNHTRRWCDMKLCGNRMKSRRFHARQSGQSEPDQ